MRTAAIIVAAGRGTRAGGTSPKQWQSLAGARVIAHAIAAFSSHPAINTITLVLHEDDLHMAPDGIDTVPGGPDRCASVFAGLQRLTDEPPDVVLIHDAARPCIPPKLIDNVLAALTIHGGAAPALPVTDALWTGAEGRVTGTQDRARLFRAQTPQGFRFPELLAAHKACAGAAADDVEVARQAGLDVAIVEGDEDNLKITLPADFARAERILESRYGHPPRQRI
ncbi:MAG: 2-C-methyl-D-erythritol 4-phosphate cytidylyltransferase [Paracoccaceae bacterium]